MEFDLKITLESLVTLIVGLFVFVIYKLSKSDEKRRAAIVTLSEIRQAEKAIQVLLENKKIGNFTSILPSSRWQENMHHFAEYFDQDEFSSINSFYQSCVIIEEKVNFVKKSQTVALEEKFKILQQMRAEAYKTSPHNFETSNKYLIDNFFAEPNKPINDAIETAKAINFISNTEVGAKLKHIIYFRWYKPSSWF